MRPSVWSVLWILPLSKDEDARVKDEDHCSDLVDNRGRGGCGFCGICEAITHRREPSAAVRTRAKRQKKRSEIPPTGT